MNDNQIIIENIIYETSKITFIVESPHTSEIRDKCPLAGKSGKEISKYLLDNQHLYFGIEAKQGSLVNKVSIINVSKFPLQSSAYKNPPKNIKQYEKLKKLIEQGAKFDTVHRDEIINSLKTEIYQIFLTELKKIPNKSFVVPCGKFAREFYNQAIKENILKSKEFETIAEHIPHPARGWKSISHSSIKEIKSNIFDSILK